MNNFPFPGDFKISVEHYSVRSPLLVTGHKINFWKDINLINNLLHLIEYLPTHYLFVFCFFLLFMLRYSVINYANDLTYLSCIIQFNNNDNDNNDNNNNNNSNNNNNNNNYNNNNNNNLNLQ